MGYQLNKSKHSLALCLPLISCSLYHHLAAVCLAPFTVRQSGKKRHIGVIPSIIGFQGLIKIKLHNVKSIISAGNSHSLSIETPNQWICLTVPTLSTLKSNLHIAWSYTTRSPRCYEWFQCLVGQNKSSLITTHVFIPLIKVLKSYTAWTKPTSYSMSKMATVLWFEERKYSENQIKIILYYIILCRLSFFSIGDAVCGVS